MRTCNTIEEALHLFLKAIPHFDPKLKEAVRRYEIQGRIGAFAKTASRKTYPRFKWIEPPPDQYAGIDITDYIRYQYMVPYAKVKLAPKPPPPPPKPIQYTCGVANHDDNSAHYANLLTSLQAKELFPDEQHETDTP